MVPIDVFLQNLVPSKFVAKAGFSQDELTNSGTYVDSNQVDVVLVGNNMLGLDMRLLNTCFEVRMEVDFYVHTIDQLAHYTYFIKGL